MITDQHFDAIFTYISIISIEETEDKIRRAAIIAAELAVINEQKQKLPVILASNPLHKPPLPQSSAAGLYAKIDLIRKHKDRLLRQQQRTDEMQKNCVESNTGANDPIRVHRTVSNPESSGSQSPDYEPIRLSSLDLDTNQTHLLKDNMIFVNHPAIGGTGCEHFGQVIQSGTNSDLKRIYTISS